MKLAAALKPARKNMLGMLKHLLMGQTLRNMRGLSVIALISIILELSTKALFVLEKTLESWHTSATKHADNNSNQYSILFKQQSPFFILLLCSFYYFYLAFSVYISLIYIHILSVEGCRSTAESLYSFVKKLFIQRTSFIVF